MADIIKTWLQSRLGVIINLTPEIFGHCCRDGTFLAKLLHSYDIINDSQLNTITPTSDPALARVNLRHLRVWLKFIGITCDDQIIQDISQGKGTASLRLFYKLFLCLENKDRLHFITLEKEREKYLPTSTKFDVQVVHEDTEVDETLQHPLANLLQDNADNIQWYKNKFQCIIDNFKQDQANFRQSQILNLSAPSGPPESAKLVDSLNSKNSLHDKLAELDDFAEKHQVLVSQTQETGSSSQIKKNDREAAQAFIDALKIRKQAAIEMQNMKNQMQKLLLAQVWEKIESNADDEFDRIIGKKVLRQSQYEKQMIRKLCDVRSEKCRLAANRQLVDELMVNTREKHVTLIHENEREIKLWENEEVDDECRRLNELKRRMQDDKLKKIEKSRLQIIVDIIDDVLDITEAMCEIKRINNSIPQSTWHEWRILFINNLPIFNAPTTGNDSIISENIEDISNNQMSKDDVLNEQDFLDYHLLVSPWDEFIPKQHKSTQDILDSGIIVLGHIIHRLLRQTRLQHQMQNLRPKLPEVKARAVVLGLTDQSYQQLQGLLKHKKIKCVLVEDAINYCLLRYKEEMKNHEFIDVNIASTSTVLSSKLLTSNFDNIENNIKNNSGNNKNKNNSNKSIKSKNGKKKSSNVIYDTNADNNAADKKVQTPKVIPYEDMDPVLSDAGYVGKWIYDFFILGEPISDELTSQAIFEYLRNLKDVYGWVLINYPCTYRQMLYFEACLLDHKASALSISGNFVDEMDRISPRIIFQPSDAENEFSTESRLFPNLLGDNSSVETSALTAFIHVLPKSTRSNINPEDLFEVLPEDSTDLDIFYRDQGLAYVVYYTVFDVTTLKRIARMIIGEISVPQKSSAELFGQVLKISGSIGNKSTTSSESNLKLIDAEGETNEICNPKPGETKWRWVTLPVPDEMAKVLISIVKNFESIYIDGLKNIFCEKRSNFMAIIPYKEFIVTKIEKFVTRPDKKNEILYRFQGAFNDVPNDARDDDDVKHELYCKIVEFQTELWDMCDLARSDALEERKKIILDHWTLFQVRDLINIYLGLMQLEMDRFMDTMQLIQNYYLSMLQRQFSNNKFLKIQLQKLTLRDNSFEKRPSNRSLDKSDHKSAIDKLHSVFTNTINTDLKNEISELMFNTEEICPNTTNFVGFKIIEANIEYINSVINEIDSFVINNLKHEERNLFPHRASESKRRKSSRKSTSISSTSEEKIDLAKQKFDDLFLEWQYAANYEINRLKMRVELLRTAAESDLNYLIAQIRSSFRTVHEMIDQKYQQNMAGINNLIKIFCLSVENERPFYGKIGFDDDEMMTLAHMLVDSDTKDSSTILISETDDYKFSVTQLKYLKNIFQRVAPSGFIAEQAFLYILQDLIVCSDQHHDFAILPSAWYNLKPVELAEMIENLFCYEEFIDWRDFLIYLIDVPMPSQDDLLNAREAFREKDPNHTDVVFRADFMSTSLWFCPFSAVPSIQASLIPREDTDKDEEEIFEEELEFHNRNLLGNFKKSRRNLSFQDASNDQINLEYETLNNAEVTKMSLIKQLLCEIYLVNYYTVNYMAMLLSFCKGDNPSYGLGNAISLSLGQKICLEFDEGEKYVNKLVEKEKLSIGIEENLRREIHQLCNEIVNSIIVNVTNHCELTLVEMHDASVFNINRNIKDGRKILIESLDAPGETVDPATLVLLNNRTELSSSCDRGENVVDEVSINSSVMNKSLSSDVVVENEYIIEREIIYWIPIKVFESVLLTLIPIDQVDSRMFGEISSLTEYFQSIYREIQCEQFLCKPDVVLIHRLLHHKHVCQILQLTGRFTKKNPMKIVAKLLNTRGT